ncbi:MAG TPA: FAD-dependent monooxygenase [Streptosporangiaceae bacterium]|nr:FAD-dependent monooxygenase [Streptosporangiaceae bacterium]
MTEILVLGAGLNGLSTAMLLARDGHQVTVLERDLGAPPEAERAWEAWERRGVSQFRLPHVMLPRWRELMERELPEVLGEVLGAGGPRLNLLAMLPEPRRGPLRAGDERFETVTARRPVLEAAVAAVAERVPGVVVRRGVAVTGLLADPPARGRATRIRGVLAAGGQALRAGLVVDCCGRRSPLGSWLAAIGAPRPAEEREDCGFVYYGRHFRSRTGELPPAEANMLQHYDSVSVLALPGDNGTWSVVFTTASRDRRLRALRDPDRWDAALARYPLVAPWRDGEPITGVDVMAGLEDRHRRLVVDGSPAATGVVAVGDAWACTNPSLGRGASIGLVHACALRDVLREIGAGGISGDPEKLVRRFDEVTVAAVEPLYRATLWLDRGRLAEIAADAAGDATAGHGAAGHGAAGHGAAGADGGSDGSDDGPGAAGDPRWAAGKALFAASLADQDVAREYLAVSMLLTTADEVFTKPGMAERVMRLGAGAARYPLPGPDRQELLAAIGA